MCRQDGKSLGIGSHKCFFVLFCFVLKCPVMKVMRLRDERPSKYLEEEGWTSVQTIPGSNTSDLHNAD